MSGVSGVIEVRVAIEADAAAIAALVDDAYRVYIDRIGREPAPMSADHVRAVAEERVAIARRGGDLVGVLIWCAEPDHLLIENLAVAPTHQGAGIGGLLLRHAEALARLQGKTELRLYTNARMTENLEYYVRRGYRTIGRATVDGFDRVYFARPLSIDY